MSEQSYPYVEELLAETSTTRADWLFGSRAIAIASGFTPDTNVMQSPRLMKCIRKIKVDGGNHPIAYAMRLSDAQRIYKEVHPDPKPQNGVAPEQKIIITAREQPIIYGEDGKQILHAMWDNKRATEALTEEIKALRHDLQTFTKTLS